MTDPDDARIADLITRVRDVPDFPKPGIVFKDLTPLLGHGPSMMAVTDLLAERIAARKPDLVVAIESRGFIFGAAVAARLGLGFAPVRKPGKLPWKTSRRSYALEYGTDTLELHADAVRSGSTVIVVDDLLATGGTAGAAVELVREQGGRVAAVTVVIELAFLEGRKRLPDVPVDSLIVF